MGNFQTVTNFENLYASYKRSMRGKGKKKGAVKFSVMALENLCVIKQELVQHTYEVSPYAKFEVSEPKKRVVMSGSFRDKVLQHCLCDYVLLPGMKEHFIRDNYAGQIGKGTLFGLDRLSENLKGFYELHGCDGYILKCDITKFFYSIDHDVMKKTVAEYFADEDIRWLCDVLIDSTEGDGLPLGNQSSQVFALMYLSGLDHFITEELGCKYYGRYMDDFYLISEDKEYLKVCLARIKEYLAELKLTLNNKTEIVSITKGLKFLGFHTYITNDGVIIRLLTSENKRQVKKRLRKNAKLVAEGRMTRKKFDEKYESWKNHVSYGNCHKLVESMNCFVEELFINGSKNQP